MIILVPDLNKSNSIDKGCPRSSEIILKFTVLAFNKSKLFEILADYYRYLRGKSSNCSLDFGLMQGIHGKVESRYFDLKQGRRNVSKPGEARVFQAYTFHP
jgi:hypothetical protein